MRKFIFLLILIAPIILKAQFTCDYSVNTQLTDETYSNILPHTAICSNGNTFISWYAANSNTYSMNLQLIDPAGNTLWENELEVGAYTIGSWVADYSIIIDNEDNCILAYNDYRNSPSETEQDISIYKISQTGELLWGNEGITIVNSEEDEFFPHLIVTPENNIIVAWANYNYYFALQKISPEGNLLWGEIGISFQDISPTVRYQNPIVVNADNENIFLIWTHETGSFMYPFKNIYLQKINPEGNNILDEPTIVYNNDDIPIYVAPTAISDKNSGCYITWYSFNMGVLDCFVNHVNLEGELTIPENGISPQANLDFIRTTPRISIDTNNNVVLFWKQKNLSQTQHGIYGQKFSSEGEKLWGETGLEFVQLSENSIYDISVQANYDKFLLSYTDNSFGTAIDVKINSKYITENGNLIWDKIVSEYQSEKLEFYCTNIIDNKAVSVWTDNRGEYSNIFMQNIFAYSINLGADTTITSNETLILNAGDNFISYLWNDESSDQTLIIDNFPAGNYNFSIIATDICGFEYYDTINIEVVAIQNITSFKKIVEVFPNPCDDYITINLSDKPALNCFIDIYDICGTKIVSGIKIKSQTTNISTQNIPNGIYILKISDNERIITAKIIKK